MVNVSVNDVVNVHASCLSLSMSACRPGLGYGLSSNVPVRRHDNAIRHGSR